MLGATPPLLTSHTPPSTLTRADNCLTLRKNITTAEHILTTNIQGSLRHFLPRHTPPVSNNPSNITTLHPQRIRIVDSPIPTVSIIEFAHRIYPASDKASPSRCR